MKFDDIISELGEFGPYQKRIYYLVCLTGIPSALQTMNIVFTMAFQSHRCVLPILNNDTFRSQGAWHDSLVERWVPWDKDEDAYSYCKLYKTDPVTGAQLNTTTGCSKYVYDDADFDSTIFQDVGMICDDKKLKTYANMIYMGGLLAGSLILGSLSDIIGRKKVIVFGLVGNFGSSIGVAFVDSYVPFVILRFITAFSGIGTFLAAFVIGMEIVGPSKRKLAGLVIELFWTLGLFILALMAYFIRNWSHLQIATAVPIVLLFCFPWLLPESPRWLINRGRLEEAQKILDTVAKGNGVTLSEKASNLANLENEDQQSGKIWQMFTSKTLLFRTLIIFCNWAVASLVYYGLSLNVGALSGHLHLNYTLSSLVEGASYIFCLVLLDKGRKPMQCFSMLLAGVACLGTMFPVIFGGEDVKWVTVMLSLIGKFGASAAFAVIYVYSAELFPTTMRNSGMGASSFSARIGGIAAPYIADLGDFVPGDWGIALPLIIFGGASVIAGLLALFLPETTNRKLPDSVDDAENFGRESAKNQYVLRDIAGDSGDYKAGKDNPSFSS